jgi:agmatinase
LIEKNVTEIYEAGKKVFGIGGEHLVTLPEIKAVSKFYKDLAIIHFDAHTDLREEYFARFNKWYDTLGDK